MSDRAVASDGMTNAGALHDALKISRLVLSPAILAGLILLPWFGDFGLQRLLVEAFTL